MLSVDDLNNIEFLKSQNDGLKKQNDSLQIALNQIKAKLNEFADKFDCINDYTDVLTVECECEEGHRMGEEVAIYGDNLTDLEKLLRDFTDFVEEIK